MSQAQDLASLSQLFSSQALPFRNRIINGACQVNQRGSLNSSVGFGGPDRYWMQVNGAGGQFVQSQGSITYNGIVRSAVVQTVTTVVADLGTTKYWSGITQFIEGYNAYDLVGKPIAVSFIFQASIPGQYTVNIRDSADSLSYVATINVAAAGVPQKFTILIPPFPANAVIPNSNGRGIVIWIGTQNGAAYLAPAINTWLSGIYMTANGSVTWSGTVGAYIAMTELQLEAGPVATPFENRPFGLELQLCQRYFCKTFPYATAPANNSAAGTGGALFIFGAGQGAASSYQGQRWVFPVQMRAGPSITAYNPGTGSAGVWRDSASGGESLPSVSVSENGAFVLMNNGNPAILASNGAWYLHLTAQAEIP